MTHIPQDPNISRLVKVNQPPPPSSGDTKKLDLPSVAKMSFPEKQAVSEAVNASQENKQASVKRSFRLFRALMLGAGIATFAALFSNPPGAVVALGVLLGLAVLTFVKASKSAESKKQVARNLYQGIAAFTLAAIGTIGMLIAVAPTIYEGHYGGGDGDTRFLEGLVALSV